MEKKCLEIKEIKQLLLLKIKNKMFSKQFFFKGCLKNNYTNIKND